MLVNVLSMFPFAVRLGPKHTGINERGSFKLCKTRKHEVCNGPSTTRGSSTLKPYLLLLFSSSFTDRCRGGTQLSVSSKVGGLDKGHPLSSEGVCYGVALSFSWSSSRSPTGVLGVVCPEGRLVYRHMCDVSEPLDLLFDVL